MSMAAKTFRMSRIAAMVVAAALMLPAARSFALVGAQEPSVASQSTPEAQVPAKQEQEHDESYEYTHSPMVQKFGRMLGLSPDAAATAFTLTNFALLAAAVLYGLGKGLPAAFKKRNTDIQKGLVDARTATEEARARLTAVESRLSKLDEQIAGMRQQAEADAVREEQRLKASLEEQKAKILAEAEAEVATASSSARRELQKYAAELAITQAARKLEVSAATDKLLVESFASKLGPRGGEN